MYQAAIKKALHQCSRRTVTPEIATRGTDAAARDHAQQLQQRAPQQQVMRQALPHLESELTTAESISGGVGKTVRGSRQYWREAFVQLMAMAVEYGAPQFFLTFTANEMGWQDLRQACGDRSFGDRPVEATRHYHHRWKVFKKKYLTGLTPIGEIERMWYRQEEQGRGSLHVHMAVWVKAGTANPNAIRATVPRAAYALAPEEQAWRQFVQGVQMHECQDACHWKRGQRRGNDFCKSGYPHNKGQPWSDAEQQPIQDRAEADAYATMSGCPASIGDYRYVRFNDESNRYEYRVEHEEDLRISPYVPLWLLAWGANMNVQYCTSAGFLGYIAKYVTKPEPAGVVAETDDTRARHARRGERFLNARKVGAPEVVYHLFGFRMREGEAILKLCTQPPSRRRRALVRQEHRDATATELLRFYDGQMESYIRRPHGTIRELDELNEAYDRWYPGIVQPTHRFDGDFDALTFPQFYRLFDIVSSTSPLTRATTETGMYWPLTGAAHNGQWRHYAVLRRQPRPVWWDWRTPSKHGVTYYYQKLVLAVPFGGGAEVPDSTPTSFLSAANQSGSLREECQLRTLVGDDEAETVAADARARHFTPDQVAAMVEQEHELAGLVEMMEGGDDDADGGVVDPRAAADDAAALADGDGDDDDGAAAAARLQREVDGGGARPPRPDVVVDATSGVATWREPQSDGSTIAFKLTAQQYVGYLLYQDAGTKQIVSFLSGEGGTGKSTLIRLLVQHWRSEGLSVIVTASSGKAARLIGGHTAHSAFKLNVGGLVVRSSVEVGTPHFEWLAKADVIVIDEISMLTAATLEAIDSTLNFVMSRAVANFSSFRAFGAKSVIACGDLHQLPAVERPLMPNDQVVHSVLWGLFRMFELTQLVRLDEDEVEFAALLRRARKGWEKLTADDWRLLESRVCTNHCAAVEPFLDVMMLRPPGGRRQDEVEERCTRHHCPCVARPGEPAATVLAARRAKVEALNAAHDATRRAQQQQAPQQPAADTYVVHAEDSRASDGHRVTAEATRAAIDERLSGAPRKLTVYVGQLVVLKRNRRRLHDGFVNGALARVESVHANGAGKVTSVVVSLLDEGASGARVRVQREELQWSDGRSDDVGLRVDANRTPRHVTLLCRCEMGCREDERSLSPAYVRVGGGTFVLYCTRVRNGRVTRQRARYRSLAVAQAKTAAHRH